MNTNEQNITVEQIMENIREEIEKRKNESNKKNELQKPANDITSDNDTKQITSLRYQDFAVENKIPLQQSYHVNQFLIFNDRDFVINAFIGILKRHPELKEIEYYLGLLRSFSLNKIEILWKLRTSNEGLIRCVSIRHITRKYYLTRFFKIFKNKIPIIKNLAVWFIAFVRLPKILKYIETVDRTNNIRYYENIDVINTMFRKYTLDINQNLSMLQENSKNIFLSMENMKNELSALDRFLKTDIENKFTILSEQIKNIINESSDLKNYVQEIQENKINKIKLEIESNISNMDKSIQNQLKDIENGLNKFNLEITDKTNESLKYYNEINKQLTKIINQNQLQNDIYLSFENRFRGTREVTKKKLKAYLPYIKKANSKTNFNILDIGCGRGEWIELMKENGYQAIGVDINRAMVEECKKYELDVIESDALEYLKAQKDNSISIITGFQIAEHLRFDKLISLFDESFRVLKSNGMIIFETPNPENIIVGSNTFYLDPTHEKPLPSDTLIFFAETSGFRNIKIIKSSPLDLIDDYNGNNLKELIEKFNVGQDYSIIGYKE
ncbi:MAG: methyltransferase domain-containing protein [Spirochaetes bacterium]|nr:methyltransferase domain-containing protein [Spirochaetota bacterium]